MTRRSLLALVTWLAISACTDAPPSEPPCTIWESANTIRIGRVDEIDLLLVSDDSSSVSDWALMMEALPRMLRALSSGDLEGDGTRDFPPPRSIHAGAISTDLGTQGFAVPTCEGDGDDGVLVSAGYTTVPECMPSYPRVHVLDASADGEGDAERTAADIACLAGLAHGGCGFEQPLEAALRALSPSAPTDWTAPGYVPPRFAGDRLGHALDANAGFVRARSILVIVVVEDEDDCSARDPAIFDLEDDTLGDPDLRCGAHPELLHDVERYARGLRDLRVQPERVVFAAITGVPPEAIPEDASSVDYDAILAHPDMQLRVDPALPTRFAPSCSSRTTGVTFPPRRIGRRRSSARARRRSCSRCAPRPSCPRSTRSRARSRIGSGAAVFRLRSRSQRASRAARSPSSCPRAGPATTIRA